MAKIANSWLREILWVLYQQRPLTRGDLEARTKLNPASISHALRYLLARGTILKVGELQSDGGRPRQVLDINREAGYFVAVDLEGLTIRFALTNLVGDIRCRWEEDLSFGQPLPIQKVVAGVERVLCDLTSQQLKRVLGVGVSYPGLLDQEGRLTAFNLGWREVPVKSKLERALDYPVFLEHDKHTCILAERWLGSARGKENGLFLIVERGVGLGIFVDGRPLEGWHGLGGELGHYKPYPDAQDRCRCGQSGCLEAIASSPNIVRQYRELGGPDRGVGSRVKTTDVFDAARKGNTVALAVTQRVGKALGRALSHTVSLLNPEIIILGGSAVAGEDVLKPVIEDELRRCTLPQLLKGLTITPSSVGLDIRLRGAASLVFRKCLTDAVLLRRMCTDIIEQPGRQRLNIASEKVS